MSRLAKCYRLTKAVVFLLFYRAPVILLCMASLIGIGVAVRYAYYRYMPASWFIVITQPTRIDNGPVGTSVNLTFCRKTRYPDLKADGLRSFYSLSAGRVVPSNHYSFNDVPIENTKSCQAIAIKASNLPKQPGTYFAHTDLTFQVNGEKKVLSYETGPFKLTTTAKSLQNQIEELQQQINQLKAAEVTTQAVQNTDPGEQVQPAPASTLSPVQGIVAVSPITVTTRPTTPPTSSPPSPPTPSAVTSPDLTPQPGVVGQVTGIVQNAVGLLQSVL